MMRYYWRFREQDGGWSEWFMCSKDEYLRQRRNDDTEVRVILLDEQD